VTQANVFKLFKKDFGSIVALTYNNSNTTVISERREFEEQGASVQKMRDFTDTIFNNNILTSLLWNLAYKLNDNNQLGLKNLYSINSDDRVTVRKGIADAVNPANPEWQKSNERFFSQNNVYSGQLNGDHFIPKGKIKLKWIAGFSDIKRDTNPSVASESVERKKALDLIRANIKCGSHNSKHQYISDNMPLVNNGIIIVKSDM
jgi:hypothetical protein